MAEKRMFSKKLISSDAFLEMPLTAQGLFFHLAMRADDEGIVDSPKKIMRECQAKKKDLDILIQKRYLLAFPSGVVLIKHWKIHNTIPNDRFIPSTYTEELSTVYVKENKSYTERIRNVNSSDTECKQTVTPDKNREDKKRKEKENKEEKRIYFPLDAELDEAFSDYVAMRKQIRKPMTERAISLAIKKLQDLSTLPFGDGMNNDLAIQILNQSVMNSWQGLFPLKEIYGKKQADGRQDYIDEWRNA